MHLQHYKNRVNNSSPYLTNRSCYPPLSTTTHARQILCPLWSSLYYTCRIRSKYHHRRIVVQHSYNMLHPAYPSCFYYLQVSRRVPPWFIFNRRYLAHRQRSFRLFHPMFVNFKCMQVLLEHGPRFITTGSGAHSRHGFHRWWIYPPPRKYLRQSSQSEPSHVRLRLLACILMSTHSHTRVSGGCMYLPPFQMFFRRQRSKLTGPCENRRYIGY